ncbi:MAG TPA: NAD(+)/NADH kinase, partial [Pyrinomonadaceae bacterium]|nr:NAD(+)/NADH kinase [Pyrinomonadaceae bacterium]
MPSNRITSVGIVIKPNHPEARETAGELAAWLTERGVKTCNEPFEAGNELSQPALDADLIVVLGGDGTMISTARMAGASDVLVLGINYGSLGYLTEFRIEEMFPALEAII